MKLRFLGLAVAVSALNLFSSSSFAFDHGTPGATGSAPAQSQAARCAQRVREAGCLLSGNDLNRIEANVVKCKHVASAGGKVSLEVFLLDKSDKLVVFQTKGPGVPDSRRQCP